jgi:hypothetical protein
MSPAKHRRYLGGTRGYGSRVNVFAVPGALEIDDHDGYDIRRTRVFYDDVLAVTRHKQLGWPHMVLTGLSAVFFGFLSILLIADDDPSARLPGIIFFFTIAVPFLLAFLIRLVLRLDVITVFGKRTKAVMKYSLRKSRARRVFRSICESVKEKQDEVAEAQRASVPQTASDVPAEFETPAENVSAGVANAPPEVDPTAPSAPADM